MSAYLLLLLGLALIFIEFFLPGAVMGTFGAILIVASIFIFASQTTSIWALICYLLAVIIVLYYVIKLAIWRMQKTKSAHSIYSDASQVGYVASTFDSSVIGKQGVVISDLKPGGYILVDDKKLQALSVSGYISQGTQVEVISGQEESLIVKRIQKEPV
jgi:membrane-bound ClpP family serine protease